MAGVTANTVTRIENGADAKQSTMDRLQEALEAAGVEFIDENGGGPGSQSDAPRRASALPPQNNSSMRTASNACGQANYPLHPRPQ